MITNTELKIFQIISKPRSINDIAKYINISDSTASRYTDRLVKNGLAQKLRNGKSVFVTRADSTHAQQLNTFFREFPRLPLRKIFSYSNLNILSFLRTEKSVTQIALITGLSRTKVYQVLNDLTPIGIILKRHRYYMNPLHRTLQKFIDEYFSYLNFKELKEITSGSVILWQRGHEFLFKSKDALTHRNIYLTATSKFHSYGVQIVTAEEYYYHTTHARKLCVSEYIIHTILAEPNSLRNNMYACLLYQKTIPKDIMDWAEIYDIQDHIEILIDYLKNKQKNANFVPPWEEYQALAEDYGLG
jgi:predicted transcriptional regulator